MADLKTLPEGLKDFALNGKAALVIGSEHAIGRVAAMGIERVAVLRRPRVALVVAGAKSGPDALTPMLRALLARDGALAKPIAVNGDAEAALARSAKEGQERQHLSLLGRAGAGGGIPVVAQQTTTSGGLATIAIKSAGAYSACNITFSASGLQGVNATATWNSGSPWIYGHRKFGLMRNLPADMSSATSSTVW